MKAFNVVLLTAITLFFLGCHKADVAYKMESNTFADSVVQKQLFSRQLTGLMPTVFQSAKATDIAKNRIQDINKYLAEVNKMVDTGSVRISEEQAQAFNVIQNLSPEAQKTEIYRLLLSIDEEILALHIKATGYLGLKDQTLRNWANEKVPFIQAGIAELALIKIP